MADALADGCCPNDGNRMFVQLTLVVLSPGAATVTDTSGRAKKHADWVLKDYHCPRCRHLFIQNHDTQDWQDAGILGAP